MPRRVPLPLPLPKVLLEGGANVHAIGERGSTPLHWAARCGSLEVAALLLERGATADIGDLLKSMRGGAGMK